MPNQMDFYSDVSVHHIVYNRITMHEHNNEIIILGVHPLAKPKLFYTKYIIFSVCMITILFWE